MLTQRVFKILPLGCFLAGIWPCIYVFGASAPLIHFALTGDISLGSPTALKLSPELKKLLEGCDLTFGNLEGPMCDEPAPKRACRGKEESCYFYKMPSSVGPVLADWGFKGLSVANNHVFDFGKECFEKTGSNLSNSGILSSGIKGSFSSFSVQGVKVALVAFHTSPWANDVYELGSSLELLRKAKREFEIVIVSVHAGAEGARARVLPDGEEFDFGERRGNVRLFARKAVEAGADLVFGHGPHVVRAMEFYQGKPIVYSLGNFATYPGFNLKESGKYGAVLLVSLNSVGQWVEGRWVSTRQDIQNETVTLDPAANTLHAVKELSTSALFLEGGKIAKPR